MTSAHAKRLVLVAMLVAGGTATLRSVAATRALPSSRVPIGTVIAGVLLALLAEVNPRLAGALALLIVIAASTLSLDAWQAISRATNVRANPAPVSLTNNDGNRPVTV